VPDKLVKPLAILVLLLSLSSAPAQTRAYTQRLYCNLALEWLQDGTNGGKALQPTTAAVTGTCWAVEVKGQNILVTAAHTLGHGPNFNPVLVPGGKLLSVHIECFVSPLAFKLREVGFPRGNPDWVALRPSDAKAFKEAQVLKLSTTVPRLGEVVTVIGFPDTAHEQRTERTITAFSRDNEFIVFTQPLEPGYSGGVVLNSKQQAIALVVTSETKQSTALLLSLNKLAAVEWKPFELIQRRKTAQ